MGSRSRRFLQEAVIPKHSDDALDRLERKSRSFGDVEHTVLAVGQIQRPQHAHLGRPNVRESAERVIETALPELGLTLWILVNIGPIVLEHVQNSQATRQRASE